MYLRLKFTAGSYHFNTVVSGKALSQWVREAVDGTTPVTSLPSAAFDLSNCVREGSLPTNITVQSSAYTGTSAVPQWNENWIRFTKDHSQNANFENFFYIYQNQYINQSFMPRMSSPNNTNFLPGAVSASTFWYDTTNTAYMTHGLSEVEFQFFISAHWVIWSTLDAVGRGGTAGIFDVESTGQDTWAKNLNTLYSPQVFLSSHGGSWPSSSTLRTSEAASDRNLFAIYHILMYNGDSGFTNRGSTAQGVFSGVRGDVRPMLYPDPNASFFPTRDAIGDTQNYMIPVYFYGLSHQSATTPANRALLNGRIPFLWRTSDNAGQTGQKATVSGVEYRFVRLHPCGSTSTVDIKAATYMVPTTIGGV